MHMGKFAGNRPPLLIPNLLSACCISSIAYCRLGLTRRSPNAGASPAPCSLPIAFSLLIANCLLPIAYWYVLLPDAENHILH